MAEQQQENREPRQDQLSGEDERNAGSEAAAPHPSAEETRQEIEDEDRFEATDN